MPSTGVTEPHNIGCGASETLHRMSADLKPTRTRKWQCAVKQLLKPDSTLFKFKPEHAKAGNHEGRCKAAAQLFPFLQNAAVHENLPKVTKDSR